MWARDTGNLEKLLTFPPETETENVVKNYICSDCEWPPSKGKLTHEFPVPDLAVIQSGDAIQEDKQPNEGRGEEHACVPAQPGKIQSNLLSKIPPVWDTNTLKPQWCVKFRVMTLCSVMSLRVFFLVKQTRGARRRHSYLINAKLWDELSPILLYARGVELPCRWKDIVIYQLILRIQNGLGGVTVRKGAR